MSLVDRFFSGVLKTTADGRRLYFPRGRFGQGYALSEQQYEQTRDRLRRILIISAVLAVPLAVMPSWLALLVFLLGVAWLRYEINRCRRFPTEFTPTDERLSREDYYLDSLLSLHAELSVGRQEVHRIRITQARSLLSFFERYRIEDEELQFEERCVPACRRFMVGSSEVEIHRKELPCSTQVFVDGDLLVKELFPTIRKLSFAGLAIIILGNLLLWPLLIHCIFTMDLR